MWFFGSTAAQTWDDADVTTVDGTEQALRDRIARMPGQHTPY
jgi:hypothetical protein